MKFRSRLALVVGGIIIFAVLAPAAILLARGYYFDFSTRQIIKTGAMVIKTEPKDATVFLNGERLGSLTPLTKRFLSPGEYQIIIQKNGFADWKKTLQIREQEVAYLPLSGTYKIHLLASDPESMAVSTSTVDIAALPEKVFAITPNQILKLDAQAELQTVIATTTLDLSGLQILDSIEDSRGNFQFVTLQDGEIGYLDNVGQTFLPVGTAKSASFEVQGAILILDGNSELKKISAAQLRTGGEKTPVEILQKNVLAFAYSNDLYYIDKPTATSTPELIQVNFDGQKQLLLANLPNFQTGRIIVTPQRQIFLVLDHDLFQVSETLKKINDRVDYAFWNEQLPGLVYGNTHEAWIYQTDSEKNVLVTRSTQSLGPAQYSAKTGYVFVAEDRAIKALEIDDSGQPNIYTLVETNTPLAKFYLNQNATSLLYLDGSDLISLKIR